MTIYLTEAQLESLERMVAASIPAGDREAATLNAIPALIAEVRQRRRTQLTELEYETEYTCQCGQRNMAHLYLKNAIDDVNRGKQYFELRAECFHCYVTVAIKFNTVPFSFGEAGDPYKSSISQHDGFFKFDLEQAVRAYKWRIANELKAVLKLVEAPGATLQTSEPKEANQ